MPSSLLAATTRTVQIIGREEELAKIHRAIYEPTHDLEIVLLYGKGGLGKSRLLEEVLWRGGNAEARKQEERYSGYKERPEWDALGNAVLSNIVDLNDVRLHARGPFIRAVREAFGWHPEIAFDDYDHAYYARRLAVEHGAPFDVLQRLAREEETAFLKDIADNAQTHRLVWIIDTAEQLANFSSDWLLRQNLLSDEELAVETQQWLKKQIQTQSLRNTTILLAGRYEEGRRFFESIKPLVQADSTTAEIQELPVRELDQAKTAEFFKVLAQEWHFASPESELAKTIQQLSVDQERLKVLHLYTGGQALLLSLYGDILLEGSTIPEPLNESFAEATETLQDKELKEVRFQIEDEFIHLLFGMPSLRGEILKALVRTKRGMDAAQLHFALDSTKNIKPADWNLMTSRVEKMKTELDEVCKLSIVKIRPDGRVALQDEIYRIYAEHMKLHAQDRADETIARERLYAKLKDWADYQHAELDRQRRDEQTLDEKNLRIESPVSASKARFAPLEEQEENARIELKEKLRDLELERLHYALLLNPQVNLNDFYFNLVQSYWLASDENAEAMAQAELWRVLSDNDALAFVTFQRDPVIEQRKETPPDVLRRVAQQEDVVRWLRRFVNEQKYTRAVHFCDSVETTVKAMPEGYEKNSWNHTFARGRRTLWRELAQILSGNEVSLALQSLGQLVKDLRRLAQTPRTQYAFPGEQGFQGFPAENEIERVIASAYNALGFGYTLLGDSYKGIEMYGLGLRNLREAYFSAQEAELRNNLSRTLSDLGRQRARRVCLDALQLRREVGDEVPIALSLNTLALIDNDQGRADRAWIEAAQALAYFRRAENQRGQGLALLQLAEALRRLARDVQQGRVLLGEEMLPPIQLLREAERAMQEALQLYAASGAKAESPRQIEAYIEMGSIQRDFLTSQIQIKEQRELKRRYESALKYLNNASQLAVQLKIKRLELDALVNVAWTHYYAERDAMAIQLLDNVEAEIAEIYRLRPQAPPPSAHTDASYMYFQQSKICGLRGKMAMDSFRARVNVIEQENPQSDRLQIQEIVQQDVQAIESLYQAADAYVLGVGYAQLFSPRSNALSTLYDNLYDTLKHFNRREVQRFAGFVHEARAKYRVAEIQVDDLGDVEGFIEQLFGSYPDKGQTND